MKPIGILLLPVFCIFLLYGCQGTTVPGTNTPSLTSPAHTTTPVPEKTPTKTVTPTLSEPFTPVPLMTNTPDTMRFILPTPGAQPVLAWRPPLYPVPWALSPYDHFYFTRPIAADQKNWPNPDYRYGGVFFKPGTVHTGIDIPADLDTPVLAAGPGEVVWAGLGLYTNDPNNQDDPYGLAVVIRHDFGYHDQTLYTVYAHLSQVNVVPGQWLQTGDSLGEVGETGFTTGPHLHFEVRLGEDRYYNTTNPEIWLSPPHGWGVLAARITDSYNNAISDLDVTLISDETETKYTLRTYPALGVSGDPYYQENLALSDLPAGSYTVSFLYNLEDQELKIQILPGQVNFFAFRGFYGFGSTPPATNETNFYFTPTP
jgi:murein DD-endopeptidase MepM/ murein hydrolase activator NlpD